MFNYVKQDRSFYNAPELLLNESPPGFNLIEIKTLGIIRFRWNIII